MKTITFYSYKGGVGRSLALANIASRLCEFNRKVCLLDFDLEAPGLHFKFPIQKGVKIQRGIVDYIYEFTNTGKLPNKITDYSVTLNLSQGKSLSLISAGNIDSSGYWKKLSSINWHSLLYQNENGIEFFLDLKEKIKKQINPTYLLIDSRTGISEMSGITLSLLAENVVVVAANNKENLSGAKKIIQSITKSENSIFNKPPRVTFVLSRIPFTDNPEDKVKEQNLIMRIQRDYFLDLITEVNVIHSDRDLEENEQIKIGYDKDGSTAQISKDYLNLFERLTQDEFTIEEIKRFENIKKSETLFVKALNSKLMPERIELITQAINLNNSNLNFFYHRAIAYFQQLAYDNAILDCVHLTEQVSYIPALELLANLYLLKGSLDDAEKISKQILELNPNNYNALLGMATSSLKRGNIEGSIGYFTNAIEANPEIADAWCGRGNSKRMQGRFDEALEDIYKALELNPNFALAIGTLAEINAAQGRINEFYLYLEMALKSDSKNLEASIFKDPIYDRFKNDERFIKILERYNIVFPIN